MGDEKTHSPPGDPRLANEVSEEKRPLPQTDVPGVRGPMVPPGEGEDTPPDEVDSWGGEGGAGSYTGGPIISTTKIPASNRSVRFSDTETQGR